MPLSTALCCGTTAGTDVLEIKNCSADILWETIADLPAAPDIIRTVTSFERTGGGEFAVGTKWTEFRTYAGSEMEMHKTITSLDDEDPAVRSVSIAVHFPASRVVNTSTLTVLKGEKDNTCRLALSLAAKFSGCSFSLIQFALCGFFARRGIQHGMRDELEDYATAALKRQEERMQKLAREEAES